jgi:adenylosuccinate lyase
MIPRYATKEMNAIWSEENKYALWTKIELAVCQAWEEKGVIPGEAVLDIRENASFSVPRIHEIEATTHHDVIAFVTCLAESVGENGRYIHLGLTSSDVLDTASSLLLKESMEVIQNSLDELMKVLLEKAQIYKMTPCIGRTHGIHAEPMTFGMKLLNWYDQLQRDVERLALAKKQINYGKISGAVGTYAHCPPEIEARVCSLLGIQAAPISTQILQRDAHANLVNAITLLGTALERMALEVRHLQRTEVLEVFEPFSPGQKGSSAMPHKKNPIIAERLCGMARLLRGYALVGMENVALWHERDISHSSTERVIWPDLFHVAHYMLRKALNLVEGMKILPENMKKNLDATGGLFFSQKVLLTLIEEGNMSREDAYQHVQASAMRCWNGEGHFLELLSQNPAVTEAISLERLRGIFDVSIYLNHVDTIFKRFLPLE